MNQENDGRRCSQHFVRVHAHLKKMTTDVSVLPLRSLGFTVTFFDSQGLEYLEDDGHPVLLPATNEIQAATLSELRTQLGHCLSPVVGVVDDYSGHQTYNAIKRGASCVLNLASSPNAQLSVLRAALTSCAVTTSAAQGASERSEPVQAGTPANAATASAFALQRRHARCTGFASTEIDVLIKLLCSEETVSSIAHRFFCSERTMYRKIRALYDELNVSGRMELRTMMAVSRKPVPYRGAGRSGTSH